jgi:hypothetical protein
MLLLGSLQSPISTELSTCDSARSESSPKNQGDANAAALTRDTRRARRVLSLPQPKRSSTSPHKHSNTSITASLRVTIHILHHKSTYTRWIARQHIHLTSGESRRARSPLARRATMRCRRSWSTSFCLLLSTMPSYTGMMYCCYDCHCISNILPATRSAKMSCQNSTSATSTSHISSSTTKSWHKS